MYIFNRSETKDCDGRRNNHASKAEESQIRVPGGIPAIVDEETFRKAQAKMKSNQRQSGTYKAKQLYLLSGLIVCGECLLRKEKETLMMGNAKHAGSGKNLHVTYRCGERHRTHTCSNREIRREYVEEFVLDQLEKRVFSSAAIPKLAAKLNEYQQKTLVGRETETEPLTLELADVEKQIANIVQAVAAGFAQASMAVKMAELEERKAQIEARLQENREKLRREPITEQELRNLLGAFREFVKERNIPEVRKFIGSFIKQVVVYKDHVVVVFLFAQFAVYANDGLSFVVRASRKKLCGKAGTAA